MLASAIRSITSGLSSSLVAAAFFERTVQIWNLHEARLIAEFETVYYFGGENGRLALAPDGGQCVTAAWRAGRRGGVACYDTSTGAVLWHRSDLTRSQYVIFAGDGQSVWCCPEGGPTKRLSAKSGETQEELRGSPRIFDGGVVRGVLLEYRHSQRDYALQTAKSRNRVPRCSFAILDAAFAPDAVCVAEAHGPLRCLDLANARERWRFTPEKDHHVVQVRYRAVDENFYGVLYGFNVKVRTLVRWDHLDGTTRQVCELPNSWAEAFCAQTDTIVTSAGNIISLSDGRHVGTLAFPQRDYECE
jgi:WD40 repeat protein